MQGNDYVQSVDVRPRRHLLQLPRRRTAPPNDALLRQAGATAVPDLSPPDVAERPARGQRSRAHTPHARGSAGSDCVACHMPKIEQTIADVNVRSHTFRFVYPSTTEAAKVSNACNACHTDQTTAWATEALRKWGEYSPWRVGQ